MSGPSIDRANSSSDIWTPWEFIHAVIKRFGGLAVDLAGSEINRKASRVITAEMNSLKYDWTKELNGGLGWDNPPFGNITPWARKHAEERQRGAKTLLLVPGSIGANWYWDFVEPHAHVISVGRMVFDNCFDRKTGELVTTVYAKDLILCHYEPGVTPRRMERWKWK